MVKLIVRNICKPRGILELITQKIDIENVCRHAKCKSQKIVLNFDGKRNLKEKIIRGRKR